MRPSTRPRSTGARPTSPAPPFPQGHIRGAFALLTVLAVLTTAGDLGAQNAPGVRTGDARPRVFFDCRGPRCDFNYYRTEIDWVAWVRDQRDAHVHVIMTTQQTGAGGREFILDVMGRDSYAGYEAQHRYQSLPVDTEREELDGVALTLGLALGQFATESGFRDLIQLTGAGAVDDAERAAALGVVGPEEVDDPWNLWIFRVNAQGEFDGESSRRTWNARTSFNASRVTPTWIQRYSGNYNRRDQRIEFPDREPFVDERYDWGLMARVVYALAEHVSVGFSSNVGRNTRNNQSSWGQFNPAIEYSLFPYEEATRRSLTAFYEIGPVYRRYFEETIHNRTSELRAEQALTLEFSQRQPWGNASLRLSGSTYLHDLGANNTSLRGNLRFRVTRGLDVNVGASYSRVRNQIYLSGVGLTQEERLLRLEQEATDYQASADFGISYQFGSIFNDVVNNRF